MKAVNLIPAEDRKGGGAGAAGRSGGGAYVLLGALAVLVVMVGAWTLAGKSVGDKEADLARVTREADAAEAKAAGMAAYTRFSDLRNKRVQTVSSLADSRFDWSHALHEVSRVLPENAWLTTLVGTVAPGVSVDGVSTAAATLRSGKPVPAVEVSGCTTSQASVAKMLTRMRLIDGVQQVSLAQSEKADTDSGSSGATSGGGAAANTGADCRNGSSHFPKFDLVVFFKPGTAGAASTPTTASQTTTTPATTTPSSTTPSTTTTPSDSATGATK
jgi:Tfp pilus assembly protein PilN